MFGLIKTIFIRILISIVIACKHAKCVFLSNQKCTLQHTLINLHPNEHTEGLRYYPFAFNVDKCVGSFNTANVVCKKVCAPNKTEDLNLSVFNMITATNESIILTSPDADTAFQRG